VALKLSSRQLQQLDFLNTLPPKFQRMQAVIEQMSTTQADDSAVRGFCRGLDEIKAKSQQYSLGGLAETAGLMATMGRRNVGLQMKVRGLRELLGSLRINYEGALKQASTPERADDEAP
jgi:hypothetical protein